MSAALGSPFDVSGAAYDPDAQRAYVRLEGFEASVAYRAKALREQLGRYGAVTEVAGSGARWRACTLMWLGPEVP